MAFSRPFDTNFRQEAPGDPQEGENAPSSLLRSARASRHRIPSFLNGLCRPEASHTVNIKRFGPSHGTLEKWRDSGWRPSTGHPRATSNQKTAPSKKPLNLEGFFFSAFLLSSEWPWDTVKMEGFELATIFVAPPDFQNFWETDPRTLVGVLGVLIVVVTGHCKNEGIRAGGYFGGHLGFSNFFWGAWRAPGDPPGKGKRSVFAPSLGARVAEQDPFIFTRDYASPRPPTLQK